MEEPLVGAKRPRATFETAAANARPTARVSLPVARFRPTDARFALRTLVVVGALVAFTVAAKYLLLYYTNINAGFAIYVPAVVVAAWYRGVLGGVLTTVSTALADTLVFLPGLSAVLVDLRDQQLRLLAYLAIGGGGLVFLQSHPRSAGSGAG